MTNHSFTIPGQLPGLNEYIDAERGGGGRYRAANMKKRAQRTIIVEAQRQLRGVRFTGPVIMHYTWYEPNRKRDKDNIAFAKKFVQDALVAAGILENDGWKHIEGFTDNFDVDPATPRIEVTFEPKEGRTATYEKRRSQGHNSAGGGGRAHCGGPRAQEHPPGHRTAAAGPPHPPGTDSAEQ